jgi:S-adenosylmethionine hydrolase
MSLITLLTDFGQSDVYVGVMKGTIAQINPQLKAIDLTHEISPQDLVAGRFCLMNAYPYFPQGTVHVAVVDPGVGSQRRAIALQLDDGFLVGPDNGLFSGVLSQNPVLGAVELTNPEYWRTPEPSSTFHGRDIFAPVGAHLASGVEISHLGNSIDPATLVQLPIAPYTETEAGMTGSIQYCDRFGNLVTNIPAHLIREKKFAVVSSKRFSAIDVSSKRFSAIDVSSKRFSAIDDLTIQAGNTYSDVAPGSAIALVGSHGWLEIAVNGDSAVAKLNLNVGATVEIIWGS